MLTARVWSFASVLLALPYSTLAAGDVPASAPTPAGFAAGFAERDITPELGMEQPGGYGKVRHTKIHDPCKVRAAVFSAGATRVALVGLDGGFIWRNQVQAARDEIARRCGIPPAAVMVAASHSHSSGPLGIVQPGEYDHASAFVRDLAYNKSACADPKYLATVRRQIVEAVVAADAARVPATAGVGEGLEDKVAFNRRLRLKNGTTATHPGLNNPEVIGYAGPTDPTVGVLGVWNAEGKLLGTIVNFACHATTNPGGVSANYVYYLEKVVRGATSADAVVVFLPGDAGDVTQVDNLSRHAPPAGERWAERVGGRIGAEAVKVLVGLERGPLVPLAARSTVLEIPRRTPRPERLKKCLELAAKDPKEVGATEWSFAKEIVLLDALLAQSKAVAVEVQAIQIGPAIFLSNPGELFCQYRLDLKAQSPFRHTFSVGYANGFVGYVPTPEAFGPRGGGYETRLTSCSNLEPAAGGKIIAAALDLARTMKPGTSPQPAPAPPFRGPWTYGNVPAELD